MIIYLKKYYREVFFILIVIIIIVLVLTYWFTLKRSLMIIGGSLASFFFPGLFFTFVFSPPLARSENIFYQNPEKYNSSFFSKLLNLEKIDWLERLVLSLLFSLGLIILALVSFQYLNIPISRRRILALIIFLNFLTLASAIFADFMRKKEK